MFLLRRIFPRISGTLPAVPQEPVPPRMYDAVFNPLTQSFVALKEDSRRYIPLPDDAFVGSDTRLHSRVSSWFEGRSNIASRHLVFERFMSQSPGVRGCLVLRFRLGEPLLEQFLWDFGL